MIAYILKSSLSLILLFGLYWFLLRKEKLFVFNRFFLVLSVAFSLILPFISIPVKFQTNRELENIIPMHNYIIPEINTSENIISRDIPIEPSSAEIQPSGINIEAILVIFYISGTILFLLRFLKNIYNVYHKVKLSEKIKFDGYRLILTNEKTNPYCFFNNIFLNRNDYVNGRIDNDLLNHELMHIMQYHSVDIIFLELIRIFYWFNPVYLLYDRAIRINHEYLADHGVIHDGYDIKSYSDKLLNYIIKRSNIPLSSGSNHSFTKERLLMMTKAKSRRSVYGFRIAITLSVILGFSLFLSFKQSNKQPSNKETGSGGSTDLRAQTVKDIDGNEYKTVTIGSQIWMTENLKTTKFNDGINIQKVTDDESWKALTNPAYCWLDNEIGYKDPYGALYNWYAVNTNKLCPTGWHIPTDAEWSALTTYLGGFKVAGGKLKETDTIHWQSPNTGATNESGFNALSNGFRDIYGSFSNEVKVHSIDKNGKIILCREKGFWWSATEDSFNFAHYNELIYNYGSIYRGIGGKNVGFSVRCLKDNFKGTSNSSINSGEILQNTVRGIVLTEDGKPLMEATIITTGSNNTQHREGTGFDGRFTIDDIQPGASFLIEYRGFKSQTVKADFGSEMVIRLVRDPDYKGKILISEVQRVNFRNSDFTPAQALVVIDGMTIDYNANFKLMPGEIKSFNVLTDKEATRKYGDKGKDGVVEIGLYSNKTESVRKKRADSGNTPSDTSKYLKYLSVNHVTNNGELIDIPVPNLKYIQVWTYHDIDNVDKKELRFISIMTRDYYKVKGRVVQENGKPLPGVKISISENPVTVTSDKEGHFVIGDVRENALLEFSYPGFEPYYINTSFVPFNMDLTIEMRKDGASDKDDVYVKAEKMPEYPGGDMALRRFIATNTNYPEEARAQNAEGVVIVRFVVNIKGNIEDVELIQRVHPAIDTEALRVVGKLDRFIPGSQGGKLVKVYYNLSMTFGLPKTNTPD